MHLKARLVLLAAIPLVVALGVLVVAVEVEQQNLARREHELVTSTYMAARRLELKHNVEMARKAIEPDEIVGGEAAQQHALALLSHMDFGEDGYFFVYDFDGRVLTHGRQPELIGKSLWNLRDANGDLTIQRLVTAARAGGGFVRYTWRKPSSGLPAEKIGYVVPVAQWHWMLGTGLYLDDIESTIHHLDQEVGAQVSTTLTWITCIAAAGVGVITACGLWVNLRENRVARGKLRMLARQVVKRQEGERAHLSRELHDGTSQTLVSAKLLIESALSKLSRGDVNIAEDSLQSAVARLNASLDEIRRISHRLRPATLDTLGLPSALALLSREFADSSSIQVFFHADEYLQSLSEDIKTAFFRVAQEALTNIGKHAMASQVRMTLACGSYGVRLSVEDDGQGFSVSAVQLDPNRGIGLRNMRERLASIGGRLEVHSQRGGGTRLHATLPAFAIAEASVSRQVA